jgi:hypothetical protein
MIERFGVNKGLFASIAKVATITEDATPNAAVPGAASEVEDSEGEPQAGGIVQETADVPQLTLEQYKAQLSALLVESTRLSRLRASNGMNFAERNHFQALYEANQVDIGKVMDSIKFLEKLDSKRQKQQRKSVATWDPKAPFKKSK